MKIIRILPIVALLLAWPVLANAGCFSCTSSSYFSQSATYQQGIAQQTQHNNYTTNTKQLNIDATNPQKPSATATTSTDNGTTDSTMQAMFGSSAMSQASESQAACQSGAGSAQAHSSGNQALSQSQTSNYTMAGGGSGTQSYTASQSASSSVRNK